MEERKARIAALRAKAGRPQLGGSGGDHDADNNSEHPPVLQVLALINSLEAPPKKKQKDGKEEKKESVLLLALRQAQAEANSGTTAAALDNMDGLAPKKINADLKREILPKLQKLEKRTQKVIVSLLRERLEREATAELDE